MGILISRGTKGGRGKIGWVVGPGPVTTQGMDRSQGALRACDTWHRLRLSGSRTQPSLLPLSQRQLESSSHHHTNHIMMLRSNQQIEAHGSMTGSGGGIGSGS